MNFLLYRTTESVCALSTLTDLSIVWHNGRFIKWRFLWIKVKVCSYNAFFRIKQVWQLFLSPKLWHLLVKVPERMLRASHSVMLF